MKKVILPVGTKFGKWTLISCDNPKQKWHVKCDCGIEKEISSSDLKAGRSTQCIKCHMARKPAKTHGESGISSKRSKEYRAWTGLNKRAGKEKYYLDVEVHQGWIGRDGYEKFLTHIGRAPSENHEVDRINPLQGYVPGNVRWCTRMEQMHNLTNNVILFYNGEKKCISEWARILGIERTTIRNRLKYGWSTDKALSTPARKMNCRKLPSPMFNECKTGRETGKSPSEFSSDSISKMESISGPRQLEGESSENPSACQCADPSSPTD